MNQRDLTIYNVGQNLDDIMNLDPRGYGVCRILYKGSREHAGEPLSTLFAKRLIGAVKLGGTVFIQTGFVLLPHKVGEMDGIVGAALLARALIVALDAKPAIIVPDACVKAAHKLAAACGLHSYDSIEKASEMTYSIAVVPFTTDSNKADALAEKLYSAHPPSAIIATEAAGANAFGVYHTAMGLDVTALESKSDALFSLCKSGGVPTFAIGDLGNEIGMGAIADHIDRYIPKAARSLGRDSILAATAADTCLTATVSDWGMNAVIAALAYLLQNPDVLHSDEIQREAMLTASRAGMVNMYGDLNPCIDGFDIDFNQTLLHLMRRLIEQAGKLVKTCKPWFDGVIDRGFFDLKDVLKKDSSTHE
ncbi:MAG: DUF4392 domain-containing protein [Oscillospiraceae bacterium]|nr:DUF4392 domain-containing protein [Oscillospiraceae bacterium]